MGTVTLEGITFGYTDKGSGDPLVLVHGHPFDRTMWQPQIDNFAEAGWRVIVPDLRGFGESSVTPGRTTWDTFARDVARLLDHLGVGPHVLGGLSMGGQIVLESYRLFPQGVRALLLADTFAAGETEQGRRVRNELADRLEREGMTSYADEVLPRMVAPSTLATMPAVAEHVLGMMRRTPPHGAAAALRARSERPDYVAMLSRITVPTLVVVGSDDGFTPESDARFIQERIPGAALEIVNGAGHLPNLERPKEFNAALETFVEALA